MRYLILALICVINTLILGAAGNASMFGAAPDLLLICIVSIAIAEKSLSGMWLGLSGGILLDILYGPAVGFYSIPYVVAGFLAMIAVRRVSYIDNYIVPTIICLAVFLIKDFTAFITANIVAINVSYGVVFIKCTLLSALYTVILMPFIHLLMRKLYYTHFLKSVKFSEFRVVDKMEKYRRK
ncbi:MAG: rod shape-determining protein MreD [Eubacteriales bacterium]